MLEPHQDPAKAPPPPPDQDFWVFGYGSLMWNPDFPHIDTQPALLRGYHRSLCVFSFHYRGTPECPGLVLGLDRGGACRGRAFLVRQADGAEVIDYLHEREMVSGVYSPRWVRVTLPQGTARAYTFVADPRHEQYAGRLGLEEAARLVVQGEGIRGPCCEYVENTVQHLEELGIDDGPLHRIQDLICGGSTRSPR